MLILPSVSEDLEEPKHSHTFGKNVKWFNHFGKQLGIFFKNSYMFCHVIQLSLVYGMILENWKCVLYKDWAKSTHCRFI